MQPYGGMWDHGCLEEHALGYVPSSLASMMGWQVKSVVAELAVEALMQLGGDWSSQAFDFKIPVSACLRENPG